MEWGTQKRGLNAPLPKSMSVNKVDISVNSNANLLLRNEVNNRRKQQ